MLTELLDYLYGKFKINNTMMTYIGKLEHFWFIFAVDALAAWSFPPLLRVAPR